MVQNLAHFMFNSDYPMDKVVFYKQQQISLPAGSSAITFTIPHSLLFTPLPIAIWSEDEGFSSVYGLDQIVMAPRMTLVKADAANITVSFTPDSGTAYTGYLRVYGLLPANATQEAAPTARQSAKLVFDTDKIYCPLIFSGLITTDFNSNNVAKVNVTHGYKELTTQANRVEIEHNLGDYPFISFWRETNGEIKAGNYVTFQPGYPLQYYSYSDIDKCGFYCGQSAGQDKWHIRMYANV